MNADTRKSYAPASPPREFHNESAGRLPSSEPWLDRVPRFGSKPEDWQNRVPRAGR